MDLVREVLDMPLVDADGRPIGRVDGIVASVSGGGPLRLEAVEMGATTLARRLHPRLARWARALARRASPGRGRVVRIPFAHIEISGQRLRVTQPLEWPALAWEHWLRRNVIERIPGG
jgi:hypothetical protein